MSDCDDVPRITQRAEMSDCDDVPHITQRTEMSDCGATLITRRMNRDAGDTQLKEIR
jgi:hypothetical protein